jgi:hypothetical protein
MVKVSKRALDKGAHARIAADPIASVATPGRQSILNTVVPQNGVDGYVREIVRLWDDAKEKFLAIGDYLLLAKRQLQHGEYESMIRTRLPFDLSTARKMRAVAEAVHNGALPRDRLPNSHVTAYELTLLTGDELRVAESRNLIRPNVYRREIQALRAELRAPIGEEKRIALEREYRSLKRDIDRLLARAEEVKAELGKHAVGLPDIEAREELVAVE